MHSVVLHLKLLFIFLGNCSGSPAQHNLQLICTKADKKRVSIPVFNGVHPSLEDVLLESLLILIYFYFSSITSLLPGQFDFKVTYLPSFLFYVLTAIRAKLLCQPLAVLKFQMVLHCVLKTLF